MSTDVVEARPSNIETAAQMDNILRLPSSSQTFNVEARGSLHHVGAVVERAHHGGGWLLSGIICINILILGCALVSGSAFNSVAITAVHRQIFLIILLLLTMLWMLFYTVVTSKKDHAVLFKDSHAGPVWLRASYGSVTCHCSHSACDTFKDAFYYLYPFNIEYSLFASATAYVMWKNVGRVVEDHRLQSVKFYPKDVCVGPVMGILLVVAGLVTFIVYEVDILTEDEKSRNRALLIHFVMNIVIVSLMCLSTVIGCIVFRLDHREHVSVKNPTRSMDVGLLVGASMGQIIISYFTVVAAVATGARGYLNALNLSWAVLTVLQLGLQNYFIVKGLHREPFHAMQEAALHTNAHREHPETSVVLECHKFKYSMTSRPEKLSWKRRVLKEVCVFLLLANVILWIMPAFGARPQFDHPVEIKFYKFTMWTAIVNIGLPFGIFYRMHSVASLFEVYLSS
ncbi:Otopetrin-2 [Liparis tanakae]|uniref:Otopetrin-2 n=1 Tax=Liparis tanakae TaxID=230148 RepID=A0A4Z2I0E4_9TELE|nr:Otopetrin-2 [Liparis tanakae]